ncbi:MAG: MarP family serine protease [Chloroflexi bacterium]|nr:MarP family serine protease [Chloroflexota bacterium]
MADAFEVNLLDVVIIGSVISAVSFGFHRGLWLTAFEYTGLVLGVSGGAVLAPVAVARLGTDAVLIRIVVVLAVVGAGALVGSTITHELGAPVRRAARRLKAVAVLDGVGGALLTTVATLGTIWYAGLMLSRGPSDDLARQIQNSAILRQIDDRVPRPPSALASLQEQLSAQVFPQVFVGLKPRLPTRVEPDAATLNTPGVRSAAIATVRVEAPSCGGIQLGSGFMVAPERVVTNAHVVSGTRGVRVSSGGASSSSLGQVLLIDPARDIAVIFVPGLTGDPLLPGISQRGASVAIIGYPGGGARQVTAAVLNGDMTARGRDIYDEQPVSREIWVVEGQARPGNSGGPLVDVEGRYVGVIFAESVNSPAQAYALTAHEVAPLVERAQFLTEPIDTLAYPCTS